MSDCPTLSANSTHKKKDPKVLSHTRRLSLILDPALRNPRHSVSNAASVLNELDTNVSPLTKGSK